MVQPEPGRHRRVDGSYFKVLSLTELSSFINSKEYLTGLTNNSTTGTSTGTKLGQRFRQQLRW